MEQKSSKPRLIDVLREMVKVERVVQCRGCNSAIRYWEPIASKPTFCPGCINRQRIKSNIQLAVLTAITLLIMVSALRSWFAYSFSDEPLSTFSLNEAGANRTDQDDLHDIHQVHHTHHDGANLTSDAPQGNSRKSVADERNLVDDRNSPNVSASEGKLQSRSTHYPPDETNVTEAGSHPGFNKPRNSVDHSLDGSPRDAEKRQMRNEDLRRRLQIASQKLQLLERLPIGTKSQLNDKLEEIQHELDLLNDQAQSILTGPADPP